MATVRDTADKENTGQIRETRDIRPYRLKRVLDVIAASLGLLVAMPFAAVIAVLIKATSPGPVLFRQLEIIQPELIVSLGSPALVTLLERKDGITKMRGRLFRYGKSLLLPTYHPAYLLRNPPEKKTVWQDLKLACAVLGITPKG